MRQSCPPPTSTDVEQPVFLARRCVIIYFSCPRQTNQDSGSHLAARETQLSPLAPAQMCCHPPLCSDARRVNLRRSVFYRWSICHGHLDAVSARSFIPAASQTASFFSFLYKVIERRCDSPTKRQLLSNVCDARRGGSLVQTKVLRLLE